MKTCLLHENSQIKLLVVVMGHSEVSVSFLFLWYLWIQYYRFLSACVKKTHLNGL